MVQKKNDTKSDEQYKIVQPVKSAGINVSIYNGILSKDTIRKGLIYSLPFQLISIFIPYVTWKVHASHGLTNQYGDAIASNLVICLVLFLVAIIGGSIYYGLRDFSRKAIIGSVPILCIATNVLGIVYTIYTWAVDLRFTLNIGGEFNTAALFPYILLIAAVSIGALASIFMFLIIGLEKREYSSVIFWAMVFTACSMAAGIIANVFTFFPGVPSLSFAAASVLFGVAGMLTRKSDFGEILPIKKLNQGEENRPNEDTPALELKGANVVAFIFLISELMFNYLSPIFSTNPEIIRFSSLLLTIPIGVAVGLSLLLSLFGPRLYNQRLLLAIGLNLISMGIALKLDLSNILFALMQSLIVGACFGLILDPMFRSLMKIRHQRNGLANLSGFLSILVLLSAFLTIISGLFVTERTSLDDYPYLVAWMMIILPFIPLVFALNYTANQPKIGEKKWYAWLTITLVIFALVALIFWPIIYDLMESGVI
ncbi:MAG: hypothetical protein ACTSRA_19540 [Promethearchaeota archaeon]